MNHDPSTAGVPATPGPGRAAPAVGRSDELRRTRRCLRDLADRGSELGWASALVRTALVVLFVRAREQDLARAGMPVDERAALVIAAAVLQRAVADRQWPRARRTSADIDTVLAAYPPEALWRDAGDPLDGTAARTRCLWDLRNTEGVTLGDAARTARSGRAGQEGSDGPTG